MLEQILFSARLRLRSDLHIGTGDSKKLSELRSRPQGMNDDPEVALIVRAADRMPIIPATALKGAVRKAVRDEAEAERLFGAVKFTDKNDPSIDSGQTGLVWLRFAPMTEPPLAAGRPFWDAGASTVITTHVAIDRKSGTAAAQKLYYVERVPDGAVFDLRGVYVGCRAHAETDLPLAFAALARPEGLGIGADEKQGGGRVALDKASLECRRRYFDTATGNIENDGSFDIRIAPAPADAGIRRCVRLTIFCRGPYMTIDPARSRDRNEIPAARRSNEPPVPLLSGASLLGVLRTRAAWHAATDAIGDDDNINRILKTGEDPKDLNRTERLFGVAGWRGLVRVVEIESVGDSAIEELPSVDIDRFSGGTLDSALYTTEAFARVRFAVTLQVDRRRWDKTHWPNEEDVALFDALIADLMADGLRLGHATNRGFGWFDVETVTPLS